MNQVLSDLKTGSIELILRSTNLYVSNGDLLESTIRAFHRGTVVPSGSNGLEDTLYLLEEALL